MRTLRLVALSDDGKSVILSADGPDAGDGGEKFELPIDDRLRAAARGDSRRLTQIDVDLGTELPPRVIQARIRSGETPEQVAAASGTRVERIMRFAHPVIQERERVAEQARDARVRLSEGSPNVALQQFMADRLRLIDSDLEAVSWDAYRSDDGTWQVTGAWQAGDKSGTTRWSFDLPSRTVAPSDAATLDFAEGTRLVRVVPDVPAGLTVATARRGVTVVREAGRADDDLVHDTVTPDVLPSDLMAHDDERVRDVHAATGAPDDRTIDALLDEVAEHDTIVLGRSGEEPEADDPRARIPAWEDIVFGVRRHR
ncbi:MAG TPA: septation protein SepH [Blastococcus sp.]